MKCPKCGKENVSIINEVTTKGKNYGAGKGCLGSLLFGPLGLLCGSCGKGKQNVNTAYWVCNSCGNKWKA